MNESSPIRKKKNTKTVPREHNHYLFYQKILRIYSVKKQIDDIFMVNRGLLTERGKKQVK